MVTVTSFSPVGLKGFAEGGEDDDPLPAKVHQQQPGITTDCERHTVFWMRGSCFQFCVTFVKL